jgi:hypothetical protein
MTDMEMAITRNMTLEQVAYNHPNHIPPETLIRIERELADIK